MPVPRQHALITGGAGFIGSHLAEGLLQRGYDVTVIDDLSTGRFENIESIVATWRGEDGAPRFRFAVDSITNTIVLDRLVSECDVIFHLAAAVGVQLIVDRPVHTIQTNITGTEAVLTAAARYRVKVLIASTSEVYGKGNTLPFNEDDDVVLGATIRSRWAYAASKMVDEFLGLAYHREMGLPVVVFRLFNTIGPRQTGQYGMVVPRFVQQALAGEMLTVYGDGNQGRCFCDVSDALLAIVGLAESPEAVGRVFNVGSGHEITIMDLARRVLMLCGVEGAAAEGRIGLVPYERAYSEGFEDMRRRVPDITRIKATTGWEPQIPLDDTLRRIIASVR